MHVCFYLPAEDSVIVKENCLYRPHWKCKVLSLRWGNPKFMWLIYEGKNNAVLGTRELCV